MRTKLNSAGLAGLLALATVAAPIAAVADTHVMCVQTYMIDHTQILNDSTILFYIKGGKVLQNTLPDRCVGLKMNTQGFSYVAQNDEICDNLQTIHVRDTGQVCALGAFTPYTPAPPAAPPAH